MDLLWPGFLFLLILIPALVGFYIWLLRRRKRVAVRFSSLALVRVAAPQQSTWKRHIPFILLALALTSLLLALTRPITVFAVPSVKRTIVLALDVSRSMCATDIAPNRMEAAKDAAAAFVRQHIGTAEIGLVAFAGFAAVIQPPTSNEAQLLEAIENLTTARRTAIGSGILKSIDAIAELDESIAPSSFAPGMPTEGTPRPDGTFSPAIIIVLTDGVSTSGPHPLEAALQAQERGLRVYTIGFGTANNEVSMPNCNPNSQGQQDGFGGPGWGGPGWGGGGRGGFRRGIDEETLKEVSALTGGEYYSAESAAELQSAFQNLPTELIVKTETTEISAVFVALGVLFAALAMVFSMLWSPGAA